jgi:hypothetical protein
MNQSCLACRIVDPSEEKETIMTMTMMMVKNYYLRLANV